MLALVLMLAVAAPPGLPPLPGQSTAAAPALPPAPGESRSEGPSSPVPTPPATQTVPDPPTPARPSPPPSARPKAGPSKGNPSVQRPVSLENSGDDRAAHRAVSSSAALQWAADDPAPLAGMSAPDDVDTRDAAPLPGDEKSSAEGSSAVTVRTATARLPEPEMTYRGRTPRPKKSAAFVLAYRQFSILDRLDRRQTWHVASVEVTPMRRFFRLNLITEVGFEGGEAAREGDRADFQLVEKLGLGGQFPHWVTPFAEFQAGIGLARVELFERNDLVMVYTLGVDVGAQWAATRWLFLHAALGWVRPHLRWTEQTLHYDSFTFKLGVGF